MGDVARKDSGNSKEGDVAIGNPPLKKSGGQALAQRVDRYTEKDERRTGGKQEETETLEGSFHVPDLPRKGGRLTNRKTRNSRPPGIKRKKSGSQGK